MTQKELKRLTRSDLLEMLLEMSRENDQLRRDNTTLRKQLEEKNIAIAESGSLAEASLHLSGVFQAAQSACEQYTHNVQSRSEQTVRQCELLEQNTKQACQQMLRQAKDQADQELAEARRQRQEENEFFSWLVDLMTGSEA